MTDEYVAELTIQALQEMQQAIKVIGETIGTLAEKIDAHERALLMVAMDTPLPADTRLDVGILLNGGEPS